MARLPSAPAAGARVRKTSGNGSGGLRSRVIAALEVDRLTPFVDPRVWLGLGSDVDEAYVVELHRAEHERRVDALISAIRNGAPVHFQRYGYDYIPAAGAVIRDVWACMYGDEPTVTLCELRGDDLIPVSPLR